MTRILRLLSSRDHRLLLAVCAAVLLVTMGPHGVLSGNEEQYLAEAFRTVRPQAWPAASNLLGGFPHAVVFNTLMGHAVDLLGFSGAQALGRTLAIVLYCVALARLFGLLGLSAGDLLFVLLAFIVAGEGLVGNEWMFRGIEPKVLAYGLVLLALTELLLERPGRCYAWLVPATYLHAFVGGFWAVIFTMALLARTETRLPALIAGALAAVAVLPLLYFLLGHDYAQFSAAAPAGGPATGWILTYVAFPWHTTPFIDARSLVRWTPGILGTALIGAAAFAVRLRSTDRMTRTLAALAAIASAWVLAALMLTWYFDDGRLGSFVLFRPSGMGLLIALVVAILWVRQREPAAAQWMRLGMLVVVLPAAVPVLLQMYVYPPGRDLLRSAGQRELLDWVRRDIPADRVFVIDPGLEESFFDFERRTGRASLFVHRFTPGGRADVQAWYQRHLYREALFTKGCAGAGRPPAPVDYAIVESAGPGTPALACGKTVYEHQGVSVVQIGGGRE